MRAHLLLPTLLLLLLGACLPSAFDSIREPIEGDGGREPETVRDGGPDRDDATSEAGGGGGGSGKGGRAGSAGTGGEPEAGAPESGSSGTDRSPAGSPAAGSGGNPGEAGSGGAAGEAGGGRAGSEGGAGEPSECGDTASDPKNCGSCGNDCSVPSAQAMCRESVCARACLPGFADCNADITFGASGDGCEISITDQPKNCGGCNVRCDRPLGGVSGCEKRSCIGLTASVGPAVPGSNKLHGSVGGHAYDQLCGRNEALVGVEAVADDRITYGLRVLCAPLTLTGVPSKLNLEVGVPRALAQMEGGIIEPMPPLRYVACPPGTVITAVGGATWLYFDGSTTAASASVRQLKLTCSDVSLDAQRNPVFAMNRTEVIGDEMSAVSAFQDQCPAGQVVTGFKGYSGAYIDALQTHCAPLGIGMQPVGNTGVNTDSSD